MRIDELARFGMLLALGGTGVGGTLALVHAVLPEFAARASGEATQRPGRSLIAGAGVAVLLIVLAAGAKGAHRPGAGAVVMTVAAFLLTLGVVAVARALGERLLAQLGRDSTPLGALLAGWACLTATLALPFVGWALCAGAALTGVGGALRALLRSEPPPEELDPPTATP